MKKSIYILLVLTFAFAAANAQIEKNSPLGLGVAFGLRMPFGFLGAHVDYSPNLLKRRLELNAGIGIQPAVSFGTGIKYRLLSHKNKLEGYVCINYGYQFAGEYIFTDEETGETDNYHFTPTQFMRYFGAIRFSNAPSYAIEFNCGYAQNISGINVISTHGPNSHLRSARSNVNGGLLLGIHFYFYPRLHRRG